MRGLTASDLFPIEDECDGRLLVDVAAALLGRATGQDTETLPLGRRDAMLLELRRLTIGPELELASECPECRTRLSTKTTTQALTVQAEGAAAPRLTIGSDARPVRLRPATPADLRAALAEPAHSRAVLAARCAEPLDGGTPLDPDALTEVDLQAIAEALAEADPQSDLMMAFTCPTCAAEWTEVFDIADFFWRELRFHAGALIDDVHKLARAYHWSEAEILALAPSRRNAYLARIRA